MVEKILGGIGIAVIVAVLAVGCWYAGASELFAVLASR